MTETQNNLKKSPQLQSPQTHQLLLHEGEDHSAQQRGGDAKRFEGVRVKLAESVCVDAVRVALVFCFA